MRRLRNALWPAGLAFGLAAEWIGRPQLVAFDAAAGSALLFLGLIAWSRRPGSRAGAIMSAAGFAWFLGTLWPPAVFWHRGPLAQLLISYPGGRLSSRLQQVGRARRTDTRLSPWLPGTPTRRSPSRWESSRFRRTSTSPGPDLSGGRGWRR
jgi:hypothetical protein